MKAITTTCDRCGHTATAEYETLIVEEWKPSAVRSGFHPPDPHGWRELNDDETVTDVCPDCLTDRERADALLLEVEASAAFPEAA